MTSLTLQQARLEKRRQQHRAIWDRCPTCGERVLPKDSIGSVANILTIAEHALSQRHQDALAVRRYNEEAYQRVIAHAKELDRQRDSQPDTT